MVSYPGCGGKFDDISCILFTSVNGDLGVVIDGKINTVSLEFRNPDNKELARANKSVEGPVGTNEMNEKNRDDNLEAMLNSADKIKIEATENDENKSYLSQVGTKAAANAKLYLFPEGSLKSIERLSKNDLLNLTIVTPDGKQQTSILPMYNYHQAKNWALSSQ